MPEIARECIADGVVRIATIADISARAETTDVWRRYIGDGGLVNAAGQRQEVDPLSCF